jgi:hypothetical protein
MKPAQVIPDVQPATVRAALREVAHRRIHIHRWRREAGCSARPATFAVHVAHGLPIGAIIDAGMIHSPHAVRSAPPPPSGSMCRSNTWCARWSPNWSVTGTVHVEPNAPARSPLRASMGQPDRKSAGRMHLASRILRYVANVRNVPPTSRSRHDASRASMRRTLSNHAELELIAPLPTG